MIYFLLATAFAKTLHFDIQKGNVINKEEHAKMFCKDILANLPPMGELYTSHFHVLDTLFQQDIIEERSKFDKATHEQIDELYEQVEKGNILSSDPITQAAQWASLLEIQQNEKGAYISQYDSLIEPWEILVYSGGHETQDGKYYVADTLSTAIIILRILKKICLQKNCIWFAIHLVKQLVNMHLEFFSIKKSQQKKNDKQYMNGVLIQQKGVFFLCQKIS